MRETCDTYEETPKSDVRSLEFTIDQWAFIYNALGYLGSTLNITQSAILQTATVPIVETIEESEEIRRKLYVSLGF